MKKLVQVEAKALADIRGKELLYVIIGEEKPVIINVGQKTYNQVKEVIERTARPETNVPRETEPVTNIKIAKPNEKPMAN